MFQKLYSRKSSHAKHWKLHDSQCFINTERIPFNAQIGTWLRRAFRLRCTLYVRITINE
jgi:hypothetical protein